MAPTKRNNTTKLGEKVLDLVIPYIHNVEDRSSVSLVSRNFYEIDGITRKCVSVQAYYYPNPASLSSRFPFIESLTLKGLPNSFYNRNDYGIRITSWIQQLAIEFRSLKELSIRCMVVLDEDLETLARTRGKDLRTLKIKNCKGFSTDGLMHVSKHCNQLRTLCLGHFFEFDVKDDIWFHELALNSTVLERFKFKNGDIYNPEDLTLLAKYCCNSLISLKIGACYLSELGDAFRYVGRLEHFCGYICDEPSDLEDLDGFKFPQYICSISMDDFPVTRCSIVLLPYLNRIRKLRLVYTALDAECQCLLFRLCPNLEVLSTEDLCGDGGLQDIGNFCKNLRKLTHCGRVTHVGLIALAKGCTNLEYLDVVTKDISNEALECVGTHLKNLRHFRIYVVSKTKIRDLSLDNGIQAMLMGCSKLERLGIIGGLWHGGLTDVGLEYIGRYGVNLRSLALEFKVNSNTGLVKLSDAGLVKLSEGCPRLRKLKLSDCGFSKQVVRSFVFNIPSLRYVDYRDYTDVLELTRPEIEH